MFIERVHKRTYNRQQYEWDTSKALQNLEKHGVDFSDAVTVLEDSLALTISDPATRPEERFITLGLDACGRLLVVIHAWRGQQIRIISARRAAGKERRRYEEGL